MAPWLLVASPKILPYIGPSLLAATKYVDLSAWSSGHDGRAVYGVQLAWILVVASLVNVLLQVLTSRLATVTGKHLAQVLHDEYPTTVANLLWIIQEVSLAAVDLTMVLMAAVGLNMLCGLPILWGSALLVADWLLLKHLWAKLDMGRAEGAVVGGVGVVLLYVLLVGPKSASEVESASSAALLAGGLWPGSFQRDSLFAAVGLLGAGIATHMAFLQSALVQVQQQGGRGGAAAEKQLGGSVSASTAAAAAVMSSVIGCCGGLLLNVAVLLVAQPAGGSPDDDADAAWGGGAVLAANGAVLLVAAQLAALTATRAGQVIFEGFSGTQMASWLRRLSTRLLVAIPALLYLSGSGSSQVFSVIDNLQVLLAMLLPFTLVPLVKLTSSAAHMGSMQNSPMVEALGWGAGLLVMALDLWLAADRFPAMREEMEEWAGMGLWEWLASGEFLAQGSDLAVGLAVGAVWRDILQLLTALLAAIATGGAVLFVLWLAFAPLTKEEEAAALHKLPGDSALAYWDSDSSKQQGSSAASSSSRQQPRVPVINRRAPPLSRRDLLQIPYDSADIQQQQLLLEAELASTDPQGTDLLTRRTSFGAPSKVLELSPAYDPGASFSPSFEAVQDAADNGAARVGSGGPMWNYQAHRVSPPGSLREGLPPRPSSLDSGAKRSSPPPLDYQQQPEKTYVVISPPPSLRSEQLEAARAELLSREGARLCLQVIEDDFPRPQPARAAVAEDGNPAVVLVAAAAAASQELDLHRPPAAEVNRARAAGAEAGEDRLSQEKESPLAEEEEELAKTACLLRDATVKAMVLASAHLADEGSEWQQAVSEESFPVHVVRADSLRDGSAEPPAPAIVAFNLDHDDRTKGGMAAGGPGGDRESEAVAVAEMEEEKKALPAAEQEQEQEQEIQKQVIASGDPPVGIDVVHEEARWSSNNSSPLGSSSVKEAASSDAGSGNCSPDQRGGADGHRPALALGSQLSVSEWAKVEVQKDDRQLQDKEGKEKEATEVVASDSPQKSKEEKGEAGEGGKGGGDLSPQEEEEEEGGEEVPPGSRDAAISTGSTRPEPAQAEAQAHAEVPDEVEASKAMLQQQEDDKQKEIVLPPDRDVRDIDGLIDKSDEDAEMEAEAELDTDTWEGGHDEAMAMADARSMNSVGMSPPSSQRMYDGPHSNRSWRSIDSEASMGGSGSGSLSRLSGLGRGARRQFAAVLDEFWGHLYDLHGQPAGSAPPPPSKSGKGQQHSERDQQQQLSKRSRNQPRDAVSRGQLDNYSRSYSHGAASTSAGAAAAAGAGMYSMFNHVQPPVGRMHRGAAAAAGAGGGEGPSRSTPNLYAELGMTDADVDMMSAFNGPSYGGSTFQMGGSSSAAHLSHLGGMSTSPPSRAPPASYGSRSRYGGGSLHPSLQSDYPPELMSYDSLSRHSPDLSGYMDAAIEARARLQVQRLVEPYDPLGRYLSAGGAGGGARQDPELQLYERDFLVRSGPRSNPWDSLGYDGLSTADRDRDRDAVADLGMGLGMGAPRPSSSSSSTVFPRRARHSLDLYDGPASASGLRYPPGAALDQLQQQQQQLRSGVFDPSPSDYSRSPLPFDDIAPSQRLREAFSLQSPGQAQQEMQSYMSRSPHETLFGAAAARQEPISPPRAAKMVPPPDDDPAAKERETLRRLRGSMHKLLKIEGAEWLFRYDTGADEDLVASVAFREKQLGLEAASAAISSSSSSGRPLGAGHGCKELVEGGNVSCCGDSCVWNMGLLSSFGVWCVHRVLELSQMESRPELWGKYTYVLNRLQGVLEPAFLRAERVVPSLCACFGDKAGQDPCSFRPPPPTFAHPSINGLPYGSHQGSWPLPPQPPYSKTAPPNPAHYLDIIKDVESAVGARKGRTGTAAGDVAFPKGKENLASVLKRYKRRLANKAPGGAGGGAGTGAGGGAGASPVNATRNKAKPLGPHSKSLKEVTFMPRS